MIPFYVLYYSTLYCTSFFIIFIIFNIFIIFIIFNICLILQYVSSVNTLVRHFRTPCVSRCIFRIQEGAHWVPCYNIQYSKTNPHTAVVLGSDPHYIARWKTFYFCLFLSIFITYVVFVLSRILVRISQKKQFYCISFLRYIVFLFWFDLICLVLCYFFVFSFLFLLYFHLI